MGWADHYGVLFFGRVDGAAEVFSGPDPVVLALHHRWSLLLQARVELGRAEAAEDTGSATVVCSHGV